MLFRSQQLGAERFPGRALENPQAAGWRFGERQLPIIASRQRVTMARGHGNPALAIEQQC